MADCDHSDEERSWTGSWVTPELEKALKKGYQILKVYEVWHWPNTLLYDGKNPETGLFTGYVNTFLKLKQEANGWPAWADTDELKAEYIQQYKEREGVQLEAGKVEYNAGARYLSKLQLNSFWGKFGQRSQMSSRDFYTSNQSAAYLDHCFDDSIEILATHIFNSDVVLLIYREKEQFVDSLPITSEITAAFVTCHARLTLYDLLDTLKDRAVYCDTDSVIYVQKPGQPELPEGSFLGELTNELSKDGPDAYIEEFLTAGPKNYGYKVVGREDGQPKYALKIKGLTLNHNASKTANYDSLKAMVLEYVQWGDDNPKHTIKYDQIRKREGGRVLTVPAEKTWRVVMDKRVIMGDLSSRPFGY
jgi:hypothetical protein